MSTEAAELTGRILIVDDEPTFLEAYRDVLGSEGYLVETATDRDAALDYLGQGEWDLVLIDQKLQGAGGPDSGIDLLAEVPNSCPGARPIMVTAYASDQAIERAFASGAYDYLEKNQHFEALLKAKVRAALAAPRERRLGLLLQRGQTQTILVELWRQVGTVQDANRKGKLLEDFMLLLFRSVPGFVTLEPRRRNDREELDLVIRNESEDPVWRKESAYILVECKNWSKPVGVDEYRQFLFKLERRRGRCRLGFFAAPQGFTKPFYGELRAERKEEMMVVPLDGTDIESLVQSPDRNGQLKELLDRAVVAANGNHSG
jgi:CheY-like chemotaxis protein